jgi:hypothetical protein
MTNNITKQIVAAGSNVLMRVGIDTESPEIVIGLASDVSYTENFQLQKANVIGHLGPVSIDPGDYSCEITIGSFIPAKGKMESYDTPVNSYEYEIHELTPTRATALEDGAKFAYVDFYNAKEDTVLAQFSGAVVASAGMSIQGNAYARGNVQLWALERVAE